MKILKNAFKGNEQMNALEQLNAEIKNAKKQAENALAAAEIAQAAYEKALADNLQNEALHQLELKDAAQRHKKLHNDRLALLETKIPEATKMAAEPVIRKRCEELQEACNEEKRLIHDYYETLRKLKQIHVELSPKLERVGNQIHQLKADIKAAGYPHHPGIERETFVNPSNMLFEMGRWYFNGVNERGLLKNEPLAPKELAELDAEIAAAQEANKAAWQREQAEQ